MFPSDHWIGKYVNGGELFKIAYDVKERELLIIYFVNSEDEPPDLVSRCQLNLKFPQNQQTSFIATNYKSNKIDSQDSVLQKITLSNSTPMLKRSSWRISVLEYKIEVDYFDQKPPDSEEKLIREFVFFSKPNVLDVDIVRKYGSFQVSEKKVFVLKERFFTGLRNVFNYLTDRREGEVKAKKILDEYQKEVWMINDGMLSAALSNVEEGERKRCLFEDLAKKRKLRLLETVDASEEPCNVESNFNLGIQDVELMKLGNNVVYTEENHLEKHKNEQKDECFSDAVFDEHQKKVFNEVAEEFPRETDVDEHVLEEETEFEDKDFQVAPNQDSDNWTSRNLPSLLYGRLL